MAQKVPRTALLATCSMAADLEIFDLLAASIDRHVDSSVRHVVVVPGGDVRAFQRFATARREIVAQEDILPFRVRKAPGWLRHLGFLSSGLRRPLYVDGRLRAVRGWMLQQVLKFELARAASEDAIVHCDSDTCFVRPLRPDMLFPEGKPYFFSTPLAKEIDDLRDWSARAERLLGVHLPDAFNKTYVENMVVWSSMLARDTMGALEERAGQPLHEILLSEPAISEYFLYGVFVDTYRQDKVSPRAVSLCKSLWRGGSSLVGQANDIAGRIGDGQVAVAVQSTEPLTLDERAALYRALEMAVADLHSAP